MEEEQVVRGKAGDAMTGRVAGEDVSALNNLFHRGRHAELKRR